MVYHDTYFHEVMSIIFFSFLRGREMLLKQPASHGVSGAHVSTTITTTVDEMNGVILISYKK